ncbi:MAG: aspartate/glutamate racemase family protein [Chloroflexota bacterium]|nr:aspartate/glutamate racemase family protein [Chloroflexota bacterium]
MKTIGLIGGLSWESSIEYYRIINQETQKRLGSLHSAKCLMYSFDFAEIETLQEAGDWDAATERMIAAARSLEGAGADCIVICSNTMHRMAVDLATAVDRPLIHIADATAEVIQGDGLRTVGLLGTRYTMEQDFYKGRMTERFGLHVLIPDAAGRDIVHRVIYEELARGLIKPESRALYQAVIEKLRGNGAEAIILGCTEIGLLIKPGDCPIPSYDTTHLHARAAVEWALGA